MIVSNPVTNQVDVIFNVISFGSFVITEESGTGSYDAASGALDLQLTADVSGTVKVGLSTDATLTPCDNSPPVAGSRVDNIGNVRLVGEAPTQGSVSADIFIEVNGNLKTR